MSKNLDNRKKRPIFEISNNYKRTKYYHIMRNFETNTYAGAVRKIKNLFIDELEYYYSGDCIDPKEQKIRLETHRSILISLGYNATDLKHIIKSTREDCKQ